MQKIKNFFRTVFRLAQIAFFVLGLKSKKGKKVRKIRSFFGLFTCLFTIFFGASAFAAGYSCPTIKQYTACNTNYHLSSTSAGNSCKACPANSTSNGKTTYCTCNSGYWQSSGDTQVVNGETCVASVTIYKVYFYADNLSGGSPSGGSPSAWDASPPSYHTMAGETGTTITLPSRGTAYRSGYIFTGWNTNELGTGTHYAPGATVTIPNSNLYFYAEWKSPSCTVTNGTATDYAANASESDNYVKCSVSCNTWYSQSGGSDTTASFAYYGSDGQAAVTPSCSARSVTCQKGYYLPTNSLTCTQCPANSYCPNTATYSYNASSAQGASTCPTGYPYSDVGASAKTKCYSATKSRAWTGSQTACSKPSNCASVTCNTCSGAACNYVAYSNSSGNGDGTVKSGCSTNNASCQQSVASVTANAGYYGNGTSCVQCPAGAYCPGDGADKKACSDLADGFYPNSAAGSDAASDCYTNSLAGKYVKKANDSSATACGNWTYKGSHTVYYGSTSSCNGSCPDVTSGWTKGTGTGWDAITDCYQTQTPANCASGTIQQTSNSSGAWGSSSVTSALSASAGYYVNGTACSICTGATYQATNGSTATSCTSCPSGYTANTTNGKTSASSCQISCAAGTRVAAVNAKCTSPAGAWYSAAQTVNYGQVTTVNYCPPGFTSSSTASTGHDAASDCTISVSGGKYIAANKMSVRYLRLKSSGSTANAYTHMVEVQAFESSDGTGTNLLSGKVDNNSSTNATNGSWARSSYSGVAATGYLQWDLGAVKTVGSIKFALYTDGRTYHDVTISVSSDNSTWTPILGPIEITTQNIATANPEMIIVAPSAQTNCAAGTAKAARTKALLSAADTCDACTGRTKYSAAGAASCSDVTSGYYTTGCNTSNNNCTGQTQCEAGYYCASGVRNDCPNATTYKRTTFPSTYYSPTLSSTAVSMGKGKTLITQCRVLSWYTSSRGAFYEYATYSSSSQKYDVTESYGWHKVSAGYYLTDKAGCGSYAYYSTVKDCPSGSYCPGKDTVACSSSNQSTVHTTNFGLNSCPTATSGWSVGSDGGKDALGDCYETLAATTASSNCYGGSFLKRATSATEWGSTQRYTATADKGYYVNTGSTTCSPVAAGYYSTDGNTATASTGSGMVSGGYYSTGGGTSATPTEAGNGCLADYACGKVSNGYYSGAGGTTATGTCVSGQTCGACPTANASTTRTTFPDAYYPYDSAAGAYVKTVTPTVASIVNQTWSSGGSSISGCRATYRITNAAATFSVESVGYNPTSGKYDVGGYHYYSNVGGGYYLDTKLSSTYCDSNPSGKYMLYTRAIICPANSYCAGGTVPKCSSGTYNSEWGKNTCPSPYSTSVAGSNADGDCYLTTSSTKYVATAGAGETTCAAGGYCPGGTKVYYDAGEGNAATGGRTACGAGTKNANTGSSAASACTTCSAGTYNTTTGNTSCSTCPANSYCTGGTHNATCSSATSSKYTKSSSGSNTISDCYLTTSSTKYVATESAGETACAVNGYCPGGTTVYYNDTEGTRTVTGGRTACPSPYSTSAASSNADGDCYLTTSSTKYVATAGAGETTCAAGGYCPGGTKVYYDAGEGNAATGGRTACSKGTANGNTGSSAASACVACSAGYYSGSNGATSCSACTGATYAASTGQSSCTACPTASNSTNVSGYGYWNGGVTGDHTVRSGCYASFKATDIDNGSTTAYYCYVDEGADAYGLTATGKICWINVSNLKCDATYYNAAANNGGTQTSASTIANLFANTCVSAGTGYWSAADSLTRTQCPAGYREGAAASAQAGCTMSVAGGKYVKTANDSTATSCANWTYRAAHTVTYGNTSTCTGTCPDVTSGWTKGAGTGWDAVGDCYQTQTPANCASGTIKQTGTSSGWSSSTVTSALSANAKYYVNGTACSACGAGKYCTGGTNAPVACAVGSYSTGTASACTVCGAGKTTASTGTTAASSCTSCTAIANSNGWATPTWSANTVSNLCTTSGCVAGSYKSGNTCPVCDANKWSNAGASSCTACTTAKGYGNSGTAASSHAGLASCKVSCGAGTYVSTPGGGCVNVEAGFWGAGGTVSETVTLARNQCTVGLTTIGYGAGADEAADCGRVLHAADKTIYLRSAKKTKPSLHVKIGDTVLYGNMGESTKSGMKVKYSGKTYTVYDDSMTL